MSSLNKKVVCIGAGPAGLNAAYLLSPKGIPVTVFEADPEYLGGISKTVSHKGFLCDIGPHRFFSKSEEVTKLWREILGKDFIGKSRKTRIYYNKKFFDYPLKPANALFNLGVMESVLCVLSYLKAFLFPVKKPVNFEQWASNKFGRRLVLISFKSYTEKVWGMKCAEISADWVAQRIKGLSLWSVVKNALLSGNASSSDGEVIKTLIDSFHYPRKGTGMMGRTRDEKSESGEERYTWDRGFRGFTGVRRGGALFHGPQTVLKCAMRLILSYFHENRLPQSYVDARIRVLLQGQ